MLSSKMPNTKKYSTTVIAWKQQDWKFFPPICTDKGWHTFRWPKVNSHITSVFSSGLCRPILENVNVKCEHNHMLQYNSFRSLTQIQTLRMYKALGWDTTAEPTPFPAIYNALFYKMWFISTFINGWMGWRIFFTQIHNWGPATSCGTYLSKNRRRTIRSTAVKGPFTRTITVTVFHTVKNGSNAALWSCIHKMSKRSKVPLTKMVTLMVRVNEP